MAEINGKLVLIVGPSGSGKGSIIREIRLKHPDWVYPISYTTRTRREGEVDGLVYKFISREEFEKGIANGRFLEHAIVHGYDYYGTDGEAIFDALKEGRVVVREVDIQGFHSISAKIPAENLVSIFVEVKSMDELKERILKRGAMNDEELERRMESARKEIAHAGECTYRIVNENGKLPEAVAKVEEWILGEV